MQQAPELTGAVLRLYEAFSRGDADLLEQLTSRQAAGISTVSVTSARDITEAVKPPRAVYLDWPLGHQGGGRPFDAAGQRQIIKKALRTLETITEPGAIIDLPYPWGSDPETIWRESLHPDTPTPRQ